MKVMNECPCKNCICIPVCRQKEYPVLIRECQSAWNYIYHTHDDYTLTFNRANAIEVSETIDTSKWCPDTYFDNLF
jgi:hypothetical protein